MTLTDIEQYSLRLNNVLDCNINKQITVGNVTLPKAVLSKVKIFAEYHLRLLSQFMGGILSKAAFDSAHTILTNQFEILSTKKSKFLSTKMQDIKIQKFSLPTKFQASEGTKISSTKEKLASSHYV